jgi:peptide deformylase
MTLRNVRIYGDPVLRLKAERIEGVDDELRRLVADMAETMYLAEGIGLAAPQVGVSRRVIVVDVDQVEGGKNSRSERRRVNPAKRRLQVFLNPEIVESSVEDCPYTEGCLSLPGLEGEVYRPARVKLRYQDAEGRPNLVELDGLPARVLQHELDHLDGVLFVDRMVPDDRRKLAGALSRLREIAARHPEGVHADKSKR